MSHAFRLGIAFTMRQEDAREDDQVTAVDLHDGAGKTKFGLSQKNNPELDIENLTAEKAVEVYQRKYWLPLNAGPPMPLPLAVGLFDAGVNHGTGTAKRLLQQALRVPQDGAIGSVTLAAAQRDPWRALRIFYAVRGCRYATLAGFSAYGVVWLERLVESYAYCLALPD